LLNFVATNDSTSIYTAAIGYHYLGWPVIPLRGDRDPTNPKAAAVGWDTFQRRLPTPADLQRWFFDEGFQALGILTGNLKRLCVLDFDTHEAYTAFAARFPHVLDTRTVATRRGYHLYFIVPANATLTSLKGAGIDLQYNGRYVVAPPSTIDDHVYKITQGGIPRLLTAFEVRQIVDFVAGSRPAAQNVLETPLVVAPTVLRPDDLVRMYRAAAREGRNEALFHTSLYARDQGYSEAEVRRALVQAHIHQIAFGQHKSQQPEQRRREALHTIKSAFSRPRRAGQAERSETTQLPNVVREALMGKGQIGVMRVLEALRLKGVKPGAAFTRKEAVALLARIVGRDTIDHALKAVGKAGEELFGRAASPPHPPVPDGIDKTDGFNSKKCSLLGAKKSGKSPAHRPARLFIMPSNGELSERLGIRRAKISDPLSLNDLRSARNTRLKCHTRYLQRLPGQYPVQHLANRLGVCKRTIQHYTHADSQLHAEPIYSRTEITWDSLDCIPDELPHKGFFLTDTHGKRYPALEGLARKLLKQKHKVTLHRQHPNYWWYGEVRPLKALEFKADWDAIIEERNQKARIRQRTYKVDPGLYAKLEADQKTAEAVSTRPVQPGTGKAQQNPAKPLSQVNCREPLPDPFDETQATRVYNLINALTKDAEGRITRAAARRLVVRYGREAVRRALERTARRRDLHKAVGYLSTLLRVEAKERSVTL
jgi:hypothetical protein